MTPPSVNHGALRILLGAALDAGFRHDVIDRICQVVDPEGYAEVLYGQAADLPEFDDEDADWGWDRLP